MQWAYDIDTKIGDRNLLYNPSTGKYVLVEATKDGVGFIELRTGTYKQMSAEREYYGTEKQSNSRTNRSKETVDKVLRNSWFGRNNHGRNNVNVGNRGTGKQNVDISSRKSDSNKTTNTKTTNRNLNESKKNFSLKEKDAQYLELAKNPKQNEAKLREMVEEAAKNWGALKRK